MTISSLLATHSFRIMALLSNLLAFIGCSPTPHNQVVRGSLAIGYSLDREYSLNLFTNGKLIGNHETSYFTIRHQGKPVVVKNKVGKTVPLWQARFLTDAPKPAVLATSNGIYLITEETNGQARLATVVDEGISTSTYQWLDNDQGQPGKATSSYPMNNSTTERFLSGGRYLLVDNSYGQFLPGGLNGCSVLDVHTLRIHPLDWSSPAALQRLDGFVRVSHNLVSCSPGKTQLVFLGSRYNSQSEHREYALLAFDFVRNQGYAVPFQASATQFVSAEDATLDWISTYFDWTLTPQGEEVLSLHPYAQRPPWHGRWIEHSETSEAMRYEVQPILPIMFDHFMGWVNQHYSASEFQLERSEQMISAKFSIHGSVFVLYVRSDEKRLSFEGLNQSLLKSMGYGFETELRKGHFQDGFKQMNFD